MPVTQNDMGLQGNSSPLHKTTLNHMVFHAHLTRLTRMTRSFDALGTRRWSSFTGPWRNASSNPLVIPKGAQCARRQLRRSLRGAACQLPDPWRRTLLTLY